MNLKTGVPRYRGAQTSFSAAAAALRKWQVDTCPYDIKGWLLWTWDTEEPEQVPSLRATMDYVGRFLSQQSTCAGLPSGSLSAMAMREAEDFSYQRTAGTSGGGTVLPELFRFKADDASINTP